MYVETAFLNANHRNPQVLQIEMPNNCYRLNKIVKSRSKD